MLVLMVKHDGNRRASGTERQNGRRTDSLWSCIRRELEDPRALFPVLAVLAS